ncbi:MAG: matrixin family metalloprotease [Planctomycetaceae bacterium]|jgi:hypothetical protein|nr:matrixin family metalloprotease [Planctomycetaceae bacterium]
MFRKLFSPRRMTQRRKRRLFLRGIEQLEPRIVLAGDGLSIILDYSLDTNNFFSDQSRKDTLQRAATVLESRIMDELAAITPSGGNSWDATITHPGTGASHQLHNLAIPLDSIIIFAGARNIGSLGVGGPGGFQATGSSAFLDNIYSRGQTGIDSDVPSNTTDYAPWGGHITFDSSQIWNFGDDQPSPGENDFYSVALHEIAHVLGVGTAESWNNLVDGSNQFTGSISVAANGGNVPLTSGSSHWKDGHSSTLVNTGAVQEAAMAPNLTVGTRKQFSALDWAALDDLGWEVTDTFAPTIDAISNTTIVEDSLETQINLAGISAGGPEVQPLAVAVSSDNTNLTGIPTITYTSDDTTGTLKFTPLLNQTGVASITVSVTDGGLDGNLATLEDNATVSTVFDVNVIAVNDKPTIDSIADIELIENAAQQVIPLAGISAGGGETQDIVVTAISSSTALIADPIVNYTSDNPTGTLTFQPVADTSGQTTITLNVIDAGLDGDIETGGDNATTVVTFNVRVNAVNNPPTIDAVTDLDLLEDAATHVINLTGITAGASESQPLAVSVTSSNPTIIPTPDVAYTSANDTGSLSFTPLTDQFGEATITVTVTDGGFDGNLSTASDNGTVATDFDVVVSPVNDNPTINSLPDIQLDENAAAQVIQIAGISAGGGESQELKITATSSNAELMANPVVTYASDNTTGSITFSPLASQSGNTTITVSVTDAGLDGDIATNGDNSTTQITFNVTVNPFNDPPTIDALADLQLLEDASMQVINLAGITAGASESQPLAVSATSNNPTLFPNPVVTYNSASDNGSLSFTPLTDKFGTATITVTVTDGGLDENLATAADNGTFATTFDVAVSSVNDNPTINGFDNLDLVVNATQQVVQLSGISAGGGESQELRLTASSSNTSLMVNPVVNYTSDNATGTITFQPVADTDGQTTITLNVIDAGLDGDLQTSGDNAITSTTFVVTINDTNAAPTIDSISDVPTFEDGPTQQISLTGISAGPNETQPLQITTSNNNPTLITDPLVTYASGQPTGHITYTPLADQSGIVTVTVQVTDGGLDGNLSTTNDNATKTTDFQIIVTPVNDAPTINALEDLSISQDAARQTVPLSGISAGGSESQPLAVAVSSNNTDLIGQPILSYASPDSTGTVEFTPVPNSSGTATITVTVTDGGLDANLATTEDNAITSESFDVEVTAINDPPTIDPIADVTVAEDSATFTVGLSGITAGPSETQPLAVTITNDNTNLFSNVTLDYLSANSTGTIHLTPTTETNGTATFTITVTDGGLDNDLSTTADNDTVSETFDVLITPAFPWHNYDLPLDVNGDNAASPIDVLLIIQEINRNGSYELPTPRSELVPPFYDVDRDGWITPSDALQIINYLNFNEHQVAFSFGFTDLNGSPITSVETGSSFLVGLYAEDLSPVPNGVYSAYIDMVYDANLMRLVSGPSFVSPFVNGQSGTTTEMGIIDEWGSFAGIQPTGSGQQLVSTAHFLATAAGSSLVGGGPADILPLHDVLVYGQNTTVIPELIQFGSLTITITNPDSEAEGEGPLKPPYSAELESALDLIFSD